MILPVKVQIGETIQGGQQVGPPERELELDPISRRLAVIILVRLEEPLLQAHACGNHFWTLSTIRMGRKCPQDHAGGKMGMRPGTNREYWRARPELAGLLPGRNKLDRDDPSAIRLAHRKKPFQPFYRAFILRVAGLDEKLQNSPMVIRHVLVSKNAANITFIRLAGKNIFRRPRQGGMFTLETIHFHQDPQGTVGFKQVVVGIRGWVVGFSRVTPGTICLLLADQTARLGQVPKRLDWIDSGLQKITLHEIGQCRIMPGEQDR